MSSDSRSHPGYGCLRDRGAPQKNAAVPAAAKRETAKRETARRVRAFAPPPGRDHGGPYESSARETLTHFMMGSRSPPTVTV